MSVEVIQSWTINVHFGVSAAQRGSAIFEPYGSTMLQMAVSFIFLATTTIGITSAM